MAGFAVMAFRLIIAAVEQVGYCFVRHFRRATAAGERPSIARLPRRRTRGERHRRTHCLRSLQKAWSRRQDVHRLGLCAASWISVASSGMVSLATVWLRSRKIFAAVGVTKEHGLRFPTCCAELFNFQWIKRSISTVIELAAAGSLNLTRMAVVIYDYA